MRGHRIFTDTENHLRRCSIMLAMCKIKGIRRTINMNLILIERRLRSWYYRRRIAILETVFIGCALMLVLVAIMVFLYQVGG